MADQYETVYHVGLFDDLHNFLPAVLYDPSRFRSVQDLLSYVQAQSQFHFNLHTRGRDLYQRSRRTQPQVPGRRAVNITTNETIDITPLFTTTLPAGLGRPRVPTAVATAEFTIPATGIQVDGMGLDIGATPVLDELMNILQQNMLRPRGVAGAGGAGAAANLEPVIVRPTQEQIEHATTMRAATTEDEANNCSICQDCFVEGQSIREINHCEHPFHQECITPWFERNVHCPVCRFDIRDTE
jgi:hypothetical protein